MKIISHGLNTFNEAGKYGCATAEYGGVVSYSYLKKGGNAVAVNVLKVTRPVTSAISRPFVFIKDRTSRVLGKTTSGLKTFSKAGKYTSAAAEYGGLVSYSYLKRGGNAVADNALKITRPVTSAISRPFVFVKDRASKVLGKTTPDAEVLRRLEEKILQVDKRLALIEKHGVVPAARPISPEKETRLDTGKRKMLRAIVEENILLREVG